MEVLDPLDPAERRRQNRLAHWAKRQAAQQQRGPRGIASAWWDRARAAAAAHQERTGSAEAWDDLARFLENYVARYDE